MKRVFSKRRRVLTAVATGAVVVIGFGLTWAWRFETNARGPIGAAMQVAQSSAVLRMAIGTPMRAEELARGSVVASGGNGTADLVVRIDGPRGRGALDEWAQEVKGQWHVCSLTFEPRNGGAEVTLVDDATTRCERE
ncbi:MAG TPA: cytochrome c oxidase assembly factor Coa1 family protein [Terracidiphilus sp.]|nr:cytochrome c oxidase assembly factor Coa1 family protein [Terracidiphilus sp.]